MARHDMTDSKPIPPDPRPGSMKLLCTAAIVMGIASLYAPFELVSLTRIPESQPMSQMLRNDPVVLPYLAGSALVGMTLGLTQTFCGMAALSLKNWGRIGLNISSALMIVAFVMGLYINFSYMPGAMQRFAVTQPTSGARGAFSSVISLLWLIPPAGILLVMNRPDVRQLFQIAKALRK